MLIPLDQIHEGPDNVRKIPASAADDAQLEQSIRALGVVTPVTLRKNGNGYVIVAGTRRVAMARKVGLEQIPAEIMDFIDYTAHAASAAENMVRAPMDPVDQWRAITGLQAQGYALAHAAQCLGISERMARRMDKLGRLHPDVLAALTGQELPDAEGLGIVASAPLERQAEMLQDKRVWDDGELNFDVLANLLTVRRIPKARAIFGEDAPVLFEEDLFAEPGSEEQFTTDDVDGFLRAQAGALAERVAAAQAKKQAIAVADLVKGKPKAPAGWDLTYDVIPKKLPRAGGDKMILTWVTPDGYRLGLVEQRLAVKKLSKQEQAAELKRASMGDTSPESPAEAPTPAPEPEEPPAVTVKGQEMLAAAKTSALHQALRDLDASPPVLVCLLLLALSATNIAVHGYDAGEDEDDVDRHRYRDIVAQLLEPGGNLVLPEAGTLAQLTGRALARTLFVTGPKGRDTYLSRHSGDAAEWIGAAIKADDYLPQMDTAEFLGTVSGGFLKAVAGQNGIKPLAKVSALRDQLVGRLPGWKPTTFGAPAPRSGG